MAFESIDVVKKIAETEKPVTSAEVIKVQQEIVKFKGPLPPEQDRAIRNLGPAIDQRIARLSANAQQSVEEAQAINALKGLRSTLNLNFYQPESTVGTDTLPEKTPDIVKSGVDYSATKVSQGSNYLMEKVSQNPGKTLLIAGGILIFGKTILKGIKNGFSWLREKVGTASALIVSSFVAGGAYLTYKLWPQSSSQSAPQSNNNAPAKTPDAKSKPSTTSAPDARNKPADQTTPPAADKDKGKEKPANSINFDDPQLKNMDLTSMNVPTAFTIDGKEVLLRCDTSTGEKLLLVGNKRYRVYGKKLGVPKAVNVGTVTRKEGGIDATGSAFGISGSYFIDEDLTRDLIAELDRGPTKGNRITRDIQVKNLKNNEIQTKTVMFEKM